MMNPLRNGRLIASRFVSLLINFLSIPLLLKYSGADILGSYYFLYGVFCLFSILDLGMGNAMIGLVSKEIYFDKKKVLSQGLFTLSIFSLLYITVFVILFAFQGTRIMGHISFSEIDSFESAFILVCILGILQNFGHMGLKYKSAIGRYNFTVYFETITVLSGITLTFFLLSFNSNILSLVIGMIGLPTLLSIVHLITLLNVSEPRNSIISSVNGMKKSFFGLLVHGRLFFVLQITTVASLQIDSLVIGLFLGPNEVATTLITWKLFSVPYVLFVSASGGLWAYASSKKNQIDDLIFEGVFWKNIKYAFGYSLFFGFVIIIFGQDLVLIFSQKLPTPSHLMLLISCILLISLCVSQPISMILNGLHREKFLILTSLLGMIVNFLSSVFFLKIFDRGYGALLGTALAQIVCFIIPTLVAFLPWKKKGVGN